MLRGSLKWVLAIAGLALPALLAAQDGQPGADRVLVVVNGEQIRESELQRCLQSRRIPEDKRDGPVRQEFLGQLIDTHVMKKYLASRDALPSKAEVDAAVEKVRLLAAKGGRDPSEALEQTGYTDESLRDEVMLPLAWSKHIRRVMTEKQVKDFFTLHHREFDGTKVKASHIFLKVATDRETPKLRLAEDRLRDIRARLAGQQITFAEAAQQYSEGPSAAKGGDLGEFTWTGKMPVSFCKVAFSLPVNQVSEIIRSPFGVHLCMVTERTPGKASLEDVRQEVVTQLAQELWKTTAAEQRTKAKLEWKSQEDAPRKDQ